MVSAPSASASSSCASVSTSISILTIWPRPGAHPLQRRRDAAGGGDMVVLDQDRVIQAEAVIEAAAAAHGIFLQQRAGRAGSCGCRRCAPWCLATASTSAAVAVATPERWPRKFSATRSAVRMARAGPADGGQQSRPPRPRCRPAAATSKVSGGIDQPEGGLGGDQAGDAAGLARHQSCRGLSGRREWSVRMVMSPARPRSSSSAARTSARPAAVTAAG